MTPEEKSSCQKMFISINYIETTYTFVSNGYSRQGLGLIHCKGKISMQKCDLHSVYCDILLMEEDDKYFEDNYAGKMTFNHDYFILLIELNYRKIDVNIFLKHIIGGHNYNSVTINCGLNENKEKIQQAFEMDELNGTKKMEVPIAYYDISVEKHLKLST